MAPWNPSLPKFTKGFRGFLKHLVTKVYEGFQRVSETPRYQSLRRVSGVLLHGPMTSRDASLSDSCTSDRWFFSSLAVQSFFVFLGKILCMEIGIYNFRNIQIIRLLNLLLLFKLWIVHLCIDDALHSEN